MDAVKKAWTRLETWLDKNAPPVGASLRSRASVEALERAQETMGVSLPDDVFASYLIHDGQDIEDDRLALLLGTEFLSLDAATREWQPLKSLGKPRETLRATPSGKVWDEWGLPEWIPLGSFHDGNLLCLDLNPAPGGRSGQIIYFHHEGGDRWVVAEDFASLLSDLAAHLEQRRIRWHEDFGFYCVTDIGYSWLENSDAEALDEDCAADGGE